MTVHKTAIVMAILFAILSIVLGAFGAHKLKEVITDNNLLSSFETGVRFQYYHAMALAITGILYAFFPNSYVNYAVYCFIIGIILFSGSIYVLVLLKSTQDIGLGKLGLITPIGGIFYIIGWILLLIGVLKK